MVLLQTVFKALCGWSLVSVLQCTMKQKETEPDNMFGHGFIIVVCCGAVLETYWNLNFEIWADVK